jgi:hypothetical protein
MNKLQDDMTDELTVIGVDGIRRSFDEHYDTMMDVDQDPTGAMLAIHAQATRIQELKVQLAKVTAERDDWKEASARHHPNPADYRYWEGRYRDEKARVETAEALLAVAYRLGLEAGAGAAEAAEGVDFGIRATPTPADLAERVAIAQEWDRTMREGDQP